METEDGRGEDGEVSKVSEQIYIVQCSKKKPNFWFFLTIAQISNEVQLF